ncbi:MAG: hypothetical protein WBQ34_10260 [Candidatus Acidiferrales bacterium]
MKINWSRVADSSNFEPLPIAKYPCVLAVTNKQVDAQGGAVKDADGNAATLKTVAGDEKWRVKATVLDGPYIGRWITDNLPFSEAGLKRTKIVLTRAGIIDDETTDYDAQPEELDGTYWWIGTKQEARLNADKTPKLTKDLKPIIDTKIEYAGYEPMSPQDAKRYREKFAAWEARKADASAPEKEDDDGDPPPF